MVAVEHVAGAVVCLVLDGAGVLDGVVAEVRPLGEVVA